MVEALTMEVSTWIDADDDSRRATIDVINAAFARHTPSIGAPRVASRSDIDSRYTFAVRAKSRDEIAGALLFGPISTSEPSDALDTGAERAVLIGLVSVSPEWMGAGVGRVLVDFTCAYAARVLGANAAYVETLDVFGVVGFFAESKFVIHRTTPRRATVDDVMVDHVHFVMRRAL